MLEYSAYDKPGESGAAITYPNWAPQIMRHSTTYYVWHRHSTKPDLDGYISASAYDPSRINDPCCTFDILLQTTDWPQAHHRLATERYGDDIEKHRDFGCSLCWKGNL